MLRTVIGQVFGTRHGREQRRIRPIVDAIHEHGERLAAVSEDELRAQTAKFRATIAERTATLEKKVADLKAAKREATESIERDRIDDELTGPDGQGGVEKELRDALAEALEDLLPEAFATVREACRRLVGTTVTVTGHDTEWN